MAATYTNREHGWQRIALADGSGRWRIVATDGSADRIVRFQSAHSWANDPADDRSKAHLDRVVLLEGPALPDLALLWLDLANRKACANGRSALRAAIDDADWNEAQRDTDSY